MAFGEIPDIPPTPLNQGWICDTLLCHCVAIDGAGPGIYSEKAECERNCCPPDKTPGYICRQVGVDLTHFECIKVEDGAQHKTIQHCRLNCPPLSAQDPRGPRDTDMGQSSSWGSSFGATAGGSDPVTRGGRRISPYWDKPPTWEYRRPAWLTWYCDGLECKEQYGGNASMDPNTFSSKGACELECPTESGGEDTGAGWVCKKTSAPWLGQGGYCEFVPNNSKYESEAACRADCAILAPPSPGGPGYPGPGGTGGESFPGGVPIPGSRHTGGGYTTGGMSMDGLRHGKNCHRSQSRDQHNLFYCEYPEQGEEGYCAVCPQDEDGYSVNPHNGLSCDTIEDCERNFCGVPGCNEDTWDCVLYGSPPQEWGECFRVRDCTGMFSTRDACEVLCQGPVGSPDSGPWVNPTGPTTGGGG